jgi:hypothetical protein
MYKICLVEDQKDLAILLSNYLTKAGYEVIVLSKGKDAIEYISKVSLWILDIMLEDDISGYDLIKMIREKDKVVPVIFTSARDAEIDRLLGFELGTDDYVTKPYSPKEVVLRVNNIIKRTYSDSSIITYNNYSINPLKREVKESDKIVNLTELEYDLLIYLLNNKGKSIDRDQILKELWQDNYFGSSRVVDDLVRRLRKKMKKATIKTIYGYGYRLI